MAVLFRPQRELTSFFHFPISSSFFPYALASLINTKSVQIQTLSVLHKNLDLSSEVSALCTIFCICPALLVLHIFSGVLIFVFFQIMFTFGIISSCCILMSQSAACTTLYSGFSCFLQFSFVLIYILTTLCISLRIWILCFLFASLCILNMLVSCISPPPSPLKRYSPKPPLLNSGSA